MLNNGNGTPFSVQSGDVLGKLVKTYKAGIVVISNYEKQVHVRDDEWWVP